MQVNLLQTKPIWYEIHSTTYMSTDYVIDFLALSVTNDYFRDAIESALQFTFHLKFQIRKNKNKKKL